MSRKKRNFAKLNEIFVEISWESIELMSQWIMKQKRLLLEDQVVQNQELLEDLSLLDIIEMWSQPFSSDPKIEFLLTDARDFLC